MSNRAHRRRRTVRPTIAQSLAAGTIAATLAGCTCQPDISRRHTGGHWRVQIEHDDWCPAIGHRSQMIITVPGHDQTGAPS